MRLEQVWLRYSRRSPWILREVDLDLAPGALAVVTGPNGAGKTTLLLTAAGLLPPARGRVTDRPRGVGWVPERFPASQPFTVGTYLAHMARIRGLGDARAEIDGWVDRLGLTPFVATPLAQLSKGTAQKVGLVQALVPRPDLLVLDEPWEGLDAATRDAVPEIIDGVRRRGGAVLVSDHLGEIDALPGADRWRVADGRVHADVPGGPSRHVIEVAVAPEDVTATVERLRLAGHDVVGVRAWSR